MKQTEFSVDPMYHTEQTPLSNHQDKEAFEIRNPTGFL
jgi:hypothetical protein